jgi:hypothetical protein
VKCYYHTGSDAVAVCKNCHRGVCADCAADIINGTACVHRCEAEVLAINDVVPRNNRRRAARTPGMPSCISSWDSSWLVSAL